MEMKDDEVASHVHSAWCLLVSTIVLGMYSGSHLTCITAAVSGVTVVATSSLRSVIRWCSKESLLTQCGLDLLCGLELCMCGYELGVILDIYSAPVYCLYLWTVLVWQGLAWAAASPSPHTQLVHWAGGHQTLAAALLRSAAGLAGALASYTAMAAVWRWDLSHFHEGRELAAAGGQCAGDLQVSLAAGALVELLGSLLCFLAGAVLADLPSTAARPQLSLGLESAAGVAAVMAGFELTGGYYSPALALGTKLGCGQESLPAHLLVYTLAPCAGALLAAPLHQAAKQMFYPDTKKKIS